jgi:hypothetical protein
MNKKKSMIFINISNKKMIHKNKIIRLIKLKINKINLKLIFLIKKLLFKILIIKNLKFKDFKISNFFKINSLKNRFSQKFKFQSKI